MGDLLQLYDDVIMDHIKNARNFGEPSGFTRKHEIHNPLCGDRLTLYLTTVDDVIRDIAFACTCCGISMASASILTELIKQQTREQALSLQQAFVKLATPPIAEPPANTDPRQAALLATARAYPARAGCATLAWQALGEVLAQP